MTSLTQRDKQIIWHPFTQEKTAAPTIAIKKAKGAYVYDENDNAYLDCISSWWVNLHGHAHPEIAHSIYQQAQTLEHIIFAGFTHQPAVTLCENLQKILPHPLSRFFFSDNGSTATEVALKMAYQYWHNRGEKQRTLFLSLAGGYHGDTFGAMAVGKHSGFHEPFAELFFDVLSIPYPDTWDDDHHIEQKEQLALTALEQHLTNHAQHIAAIILEPLIQGASGMRICRKEFITQVISRVRAAGILVIFDEVMTGFGRTGSYFALEQIGIVPDFLCLSKGLTGGFLPLSLTVTTENIYSAFLHQEWHYAFAHGHSYTANPLACAAAICSLDILRRTSTQEAIKNISQAHVDGIAFLKAQCKFIKHTRSLGTISAFTVEHASLSNAVMKEKFLAAGLLLRPLGNTVYFLPPYCTTSDELKNAYDKVAEVFNAAVTA